MWGAIAAIGASVAQGVGSALSEHQRAKKELAFKREVAQNAHQWEVEDLKKAGLNPILSASGSSAGAIAGSSINAADYSQAFEGLSNSAKAYFATRASDDQHEIAKQQLDNLKAEETTNIALGNMYRTQALVNNTSASLLDFQYNRERPFAEWVNQNPDIVRNWDLIDKGLSSANSAASIINPLGRLPSLVDMFKTKTRPSPVFVNGYRKH